MTNKNSRYLRKLIRLIAVYAQSHAYLWFDTIFFFILSKNWLANFIAIFDTLSSFLPEIHPKKKNYFPHFKFYFFSFSRKIARRKII